MVVVQLGAGRIGIDPAFTIYPLVVCYLLKDSWGVIDGYRSFVLEVIEQMTPPRMLHRVEELFDASSLALRRWFSPIDNFHDSSPMTD